MNTINDMQNRRDFLKTAAFAALGSGRQRIFHKSSFPSPWQAMF